MTTRVSPLFSLPLKEQAVSYPQLWKLPVKGVCGFQIEAESISEADHVGWLSARELKILETLRSCRRREWLGGRLAAKAAVSRLLALNSLPSTIEILPGDLGQPLVFGLADDLVRVSISHLRAGRIVAVASHGKSGLGVDLAALGYVQMADLQPLAFSETDLAMLPVPSSERHMLSLWVAKEAASKAAGTGLRGRPIDWSVSAWYYQKRSHTHPQVRIDIDYRGQRLPTLVWYEANEVVGFCHPDLVLSI